MAKSKSATSFGEKRALLAQLMESVSGEVKPDLGQRVESATAAAGAAYRLSKADQLLAQHTNYELLNKPLRGC